MIRKFFGMMIFVATITLASFGQNIFGRSDIDHWAQAMQHQNAQSKTGSKAGMAANALKKTDVFIQDIVTQSGSGPAMTCSFDDPLSVMTDLRA